MDRQLPRRTSQGSYEAYRHRKARWESLTAMLVVVAIIGLILATRGSHLPRVESPPITVTPRAETPSVPAGDPPLAVVAVKPPLIPDEPTAAPRDAPPRVVAPETTARLTPQKIRKPLM